MKIKLLAIGLLACVACQQPNSDGKVVRQDSNLADTLKIAATDSSVKALATNPKDSLQPYTFVESKTLIPGTYRMWDGEDDPEFLVNKQWMDLYKTKDSFVLAPLVYSITKGFDECATMDTKTVVSANESLLFLDIPNLKLVPQSIIKPSKDKLWPQESLTVTYNGVEYTLKASGDKSNGERQYVDNDQTELFYEVENYSLSLQVDGQAERKLFEVGTFENTFMYIEFIGDLDADGKLDFLFSVPRNYEEHRMLLFLSSDPKEAYESSLAFDC